MRKRARFGWRKDLPDHRDLKFRKLMKVPTQLPVEVNLIPICPPVEDQEELGSCTANALVGNMEFLELKENREKKIKRFINLSRLFVYWNERYIEHTINEDSGAEIRDGIKSLAKWGVCDEAIWPYNIEKFKEKPPYKCFEDAKYHQILEYSRLTTLTEMKICLASGYPFVYGFTVYEDFESERMAKTGVLYMPKKNEEFVGGHAVMAVGYNDKTQRLYVRNSWGDKWGINGYFTMPYGYVRSRKYSDDYWTIRKAEWPKAA